MALGQMLADGARLSGAPELAAAVATAVQRVLLTSICRGFSFGESASGIAPGAAAANIHIPVKPAVINPGGCCLPPGDSS